LRWRTESDLADIYVAQGKFAEAEEMLRDAIDTAVKARLAVSAEYRISFLDQAPFYDRYVRFLVSRGRKAEALIIAELGRSPTLAEALDVGGGREHSAAFSLQHLQSTLRRGQVVLAYWLAEQESYLWAITSTRVELFKLPAEVEIQAVLEPYQKKILDHRDLGDTPAGQKLYEMLVRPAEGLVPKGSDVIVVPHRKLYDFNFETLIVPGPQPHYWIEDVEIQNAGFLAALTKPRHTGPGNAKKLLLIGDPIEADTEFPTLKHAAEEMQRVEGHFSPVEEKVISGAEAVPQSYASSHPNGFRYVHFVTHGTANVEKPLESAIILSRDPSRAYKLYAREIMATPQHAELVTISACYSAGARAFSGEGLVGLAWAFMRAGAHQVIAALWEVDDASTPLVMDEFYSDLSQGKSAAEALRAAKLKTLHSSDFHRRPYYWASLQLYTGS
jgi:CHAT domain-containing protein